MDKRNKEQLLFLGLTLVAFGVFLYFHKKNPPANQYATTDELLPTDQATFLPDTYPNGGSDLQQPENFETGGNSTYLTYNIAPASLSQMPQKGTSPTSGTGCGCNTGTCATLGGAPVFAPNFSLTNSFLKSQLDNMVSVGS